jgi:putative ABC transport system ATP-binding protein
MTPVLELHGVRMTYPGPVEALRGVDFSVRAGELVAVVGPSGSGKSTMLHVMGTLEAPTGGTVLVEGRDVSSLPDRDVAAFRSRRIGFVFQQFFLMESLTAVENVAQGLLYAGVPHRRRTEAAVGALRRVGLGERLDHRSVTMSGGERQRVAIARAIVAWPAVVFADEPTGNLDSETGAGIIRLLHELNEDGTTIVVVTHEDRVSTAMRRRVEILDGRIERDVTVR